MHRAGIGHLIGRPAVDKFWLRRLGLDSRVHRHGLSVRRGSSGLTDEVWPDATRLPIWNRLGYCLVHPGLQPVGNR